MPGGSAARAGHARSPPQSVLNMLAGLVPLPLRPQWPAEWKQHWLVHPSAEPGATLGPARYCQRQGPPCGHMLRPDAGDSLGPARCSQTGIWGRTLEPKGPIKARSSNKVPVISGAAGCFTARKSAPRGTTSAWPLPSRAGTGLIQLAVAPLPMSPLITPLTFTGPPSPRSPLAFGPCTAHD